MAEVRLRPIRTSDAELCLRWVSDPDVARYLGLVRPPASVEEERSWIAGVLAEREQQRLFIVEDEEGRPLGTGGLRGIDREAGSAFLGIMIGEKRLWDQGYGTAATKALVRLGFQRLDLREIALFCHRGNRRGLRCYQKAGFRAGKARPGGVVTGGAEVRMRITREDWERETKLGECLPA